MSEQYGFFGGTPPHQARSETSHAAAVEIKEDAGTLRSRVATYLARCGALGATDEEIQDTLKMPANTERPRRRELTISGRVHDSGFTRKTRAGRAAVVWVIS